MGLLVLVFNISVEVPNEYAVALADTDDLILVSWIENDGRQRIGVADEALKVVWHCLLSFVVPDLHHAIFSTGKHIA